MPIRKLGKHSIGARVVLGLIPTVGILYANVAPIIVSALEQSSLFTAKSAGLAFSANMLGTAVGGLVVIALVRKLPWRQSCLALFAIIAMLDLTSIWATNPDWLVIIRFMHGLAGGAVMGFGSIVIARAGSPERTFAIMIAIQLGLGGLVTAALAPLIEDYGAYPIWACLLAFTILTACLVSLLDEYASADANPHTAVATERKPWPIYAGALAALLLYQAGQMAAFTYMYEIGQAHGLLGSFIGWVIATGLWIAVPTALLVAYWALRSGRVLPCVGGSLLTALAIALLLVETKTSFLLGNIFYGVFFSVTIPYLLGNVAQMDNTGQAASVGAFISSIGLAAGPYIAAFLAGSANYESVLYLSVVVIVVGAIIAIFPSRFLDVDGAFDLAKTEISSQQEPGGIS